MDPERSHFVIGWIGDGGLDAGIPDARILPLSHDDPAATGADVVVVDSRRFASVADYEHVWRRLECPVLHIAQDTLLADLLAQIPDKDDVCLAAMPSQLVAQRIRKLLASRQGAVDPLTGLLERTRFTALVTRLAAAADETSPASVLLCDVDHFKRINDEYGHRAGDDLLQQVGKLLTELCEPGQFPARYRGEEFGVLLTAFDERAIRFAESIREAIARAELVDGLRVTVSLGVATSRCPTPPELLLSEAEEALYAAKANGRNRTEHFNQLRDASLRNGEELSVMGLEHRARVLSERVTNYITQRSRKILQRVSREAQTDGLTQVHTRRHLDRRLQAEFENAAASGSLTVALLDVDHFGRVNKTHGWPTGDKVLQEVCELIRQHTRQTDWIGRYGGEEFCVVMPGTDLQQANAVLERLRQAVQQHPFETTSAESLTVTVSIGAVQQRDGDASPSDMLERASQQTLAAKRAGRNRLCWA